MAVIAREMARISPARICWAQVSTTWSVVGGIRLLFLSEQLARNDEFLNFAGAFADGTELDVAIELFRGIVLDEAVATVDLHALIGHADGNFTGEKLCHAGFASKAGVVLIGEPSSLINEQAGRFDLRRHVGEFELNGLELTDSLPELFALLGVLDRGI